MIIAVVSDTHRQRTYLKQLQEHVNEADMIIHLGDNVEDVQEIQKYFNGEILFVKGNCDFVSSTPKERIETIQGKKFLITHGHEYGVKIDLLNLKYRAKEINADIVLFGHTHVAQIVYEEGIWFINPGSLALPRNRFASIAIIQLENGEINANIKDIQW